MPTRTKADRLPIAQSICLIVGMSLSGWAAIIWGFVILTGG